MAAAHVMCGRSGVPKVAEWSEPARLPVRFLRFVTNGWGEPADRRDRPSSRLSVRAPWSPAVSPISDTVGAWTVATWLRIASPYRPGEVGQDHREISGPLGWLEYLSKHSSRGVAHYQRRGMPAGWESTGRLWPKGGSWPTLEPIVLTLDDATLRRLRRLVRSYIVAQAAQQGAGGTTGIG